MEDIFNEVTDNLTEEIVSDKLLADKNIIYDVIMELLNINYLKEPSVRIKDNSVYIMNRKLFSVDYVGSNTVDLLLYSNIFFKFDAVTLTVNLYKKYGYYVRNINYLGYTDDYDFIDRHSIFVLDNDIPFFPVIYYSNDKYTGKGLKHIKSFKIESGFFDNVDIFCNFCSSIFKYNKKVETLYIGNDTYIGNGYVKSLVTKNEFIYDLQDHDLVGNDLTCGWWYLKITKN